MVPDVAGPIHPYDRHVGRYGAQLARRMIGVAGISAADRVLDVGCGTGQLTVELAAAVGAGHVSAIDPAAAMMEVAVARVPGADIRLGSAEALPFPAGHFDAVVAQLVVNLTDDPPATVREMARVARPGAVVAACFWDDRRMPLLRSFWDAARAVAPGALAGVDDRSRVGLADGSLIERWWQQAGLSEIEAGEFEASAAYEDFDDLFFAFEHGAGESGRLYLSLEPDQRSALRADAHSRLGSPAGRFRLEATVRFVRGLR